MKQICHPLASFFVTKEQSAVISGTSNYISGCARTIVKGTSRVNAIKPLDSAVFSYNRMTVSDRVYVNVVNQFDLTLFLTRCNEQELYVTIA